MGAPHEHAPRLCLGEAGTRESAGRHHAATCHRCLPISAETLGYLRHPTVVRAGIPLATGSNQFSYLRLHLPLAGAGALALPGPI